MNFFRLFAVLVAMILPALGQGTGVPQPGPTPSATPAGPIAMQLGSPLALTQKPLLLTGRMGRWIPVAVMLTNTGDPVSGEVRLRFTSSSSFQAAPNEFYAPVELPTISRKVVWLYARLERPETTGIEVTFSGRGFKPLAQQVELRPLDETQRLILIVTDGDEQLSYLAGYRGPGMGLVPPQNENQMPNMGSSQSPLRPLSAAREMVPDRWLGLDAVDLLVLGDFPHAQLLPAQVDALRGYAHGGGTLLVPVGARWQRLAQSPLADLWPLRLASSSAADAAQVHELASRYIPRARNGADRLGGAPVVLGRGAPRPGAVLVQGTSQSPLFLRGETGAGRCLLLTYDPMQPPFIGWRGLQPLWLHIFSSCAHPNRLTGVEPNAAFGSGGFAQGYPPQAADYGSGRSVTGDLLDVLSRAKQLRMPPVSQIAWFLALYVFFLVPVNYTVLRFFDRRELAWITIPAIVVAFSVLAYQSALALRGRAILTREVDIVQSATDSSGGRVDTLFWLFSPRRTSYDISSRGQGAAVADYMQYNRDPASASISEPTDGSSFVIQGVRLYQWTDRPFVAQSLVDLKGGVRIGAGPGGAVTNATPYDLHGAVLVEDGRVTGLGDMKAGASAKPGAGDGLREISPDLTGRILNASKLEGVFDETTLGNNIPAVALRAALGADWGKLNNQAVLVAWSKTAASKVSFPGQPNGREVTLWVFRVPDRVARRSAGAEARVHLSAYEHPYSPGRLAPTYQRQTAAVAYYDCALPGTTPAAGGARSASAASYEVVVSGTGLDLQRASRGMFDPSFANGAGTEKPSPPRLEAWDPARDAWVAVGGKVRHSGGAGGWKLQAAVRPEWLAAAEPQLRLRVHLAGERLRISTVRVGRGVVGF